MHVERSYVVCSHVVFGYLMFTKVFYQFMIRFNLSFASKMAYFKI